MIKIVLTAGCNAFLHELLSSLFNNNNTSKFCQYMKHAARLKFSPILRQIKSSLLYP